MQKSKQDFNFFTLYSMNNLCVTLFSKTISQFFWWFAVLGTAKTPLFSEKDFLQKKTTIIDYKVN